MNGQEHATNHGMPGPPSETIEVAGLAISRAVVPHALLGEAHAISRDGRVLTHMTPLDWDRPTEIPAIAAPGALPAGTGGAIMNAIAERAVAACVPSLRYAGPYPTPALYRSLLRSFRASHDEATFTRDLLARIASLARTEIAVDFTPAPHRRIPHAHGVSEVRDGLERTSIDGVTYERPVQRDDRCAHVGTAHSDDRHAHVGTAHSDDRRADVVSRGDVGVARLVGEGDRWAAEVWFGDRPYARVASLSVDGALVDGPHAIPPITSSVLGQTFPPALCAVLGELIAELVPAPLAGAAEQVLSTSTIRWADLGARVARATDDGFEVHAALWERIAPHGMARVALAIAEALAPVVTSTLVRRVLADPSVRPSP
jgi:hypothetical protein